MFFWPTFVEVCLRIMPVIKTAEAALADTTPPARASARIASIDIFRGLTVLVMVFVDNLDFVKGLPWWTYHLPREANGITYVDMVFPAFLFIMGLSIPLGVHHRIAAGDSRGKICVHLLARALSLVALGLFIANGSQVDPVQTHISAVLWELLGFAGIAMFWGAPGFAAADKRLHRILKLSGLFLLAMLAIIFRRTTAEGHVAWLDFSDWEILGLLGWAFLLVGSLYLFFKKRALPLALSLAVLVALNTLSAAGRFHWLSRFPPYAQPFAAGLASIAMAGLLASLIFLDDALVSSLRAKTIAALSYAAVLAIAAKLLTPFGISKLRDTPSWCLYCSAANILLFLLLYWIGDVKHYTKWAAFITPIGASALLAYMLAYVAYSTPTLFRLTADGTEGWYGVLRSLLFTALVLITATVLTRFKFRLQV
jgi:heparan-alpha-glucosaminide N-acetyltransferase